MPENRLAKGPADVGDERRLLEARERDRGREAVSSELDLLEMVGHNLGEHTLVVAHHHEFTYGVALIAAGLLRLIEEHLGAVGEELLRGERVLETHLLVEALQGRADPLKRRAGLSDSSQGIALGQPDEGNVGSAKAGLAQRDQHRGTDHFAATGDGVMSASPIAEGGSRLPQEAGGLCLGMERRVELVDSCLGLQHGHGSALLSGDVAAQSWRP